MSAKQLKISKSLSLPLEAVTQTFAILAKKGAGKSHTASVMAEEMMKAGQQCIMLDPTGAWWGLKSSADGKSEGFPVVVFGGDHADVPLNESSGEIIAQAIVEKGFSAILDFSQMRKTQMRSFATIFLETLYRINRETIHLFMDEADLFAPQKMTPDIARLLGAAEDIVLRGRKRGIGCTMITQRSARINKDILTQCEILIALRIIHPIDINTVMEWVNVHADKKQAKQMIDSLPSMQIGTAWFWSPGWLDIFQQLEIRKRDTFDSGATPKPGEVIKQPKRLAKVDIKQLGKSIEEIVEKKKAEDPRHLQKEVAELKKQLQQKSSVKEKIVYKTDKQIDPSIIERFKKEIIRLGELRMQDFKIFQNLKREIMKYQTVFNKIGKLLDELKDLGIEINLPPPEKIQMPKVQFSVPNFKIQAKEEHRLKIKPKHHEIPKPVRNDEIQGNGSLGICERTILSVLAEQDRPATKRKLGILSGYSSTSGSFSNALSKLKSRGFIERNGDAITVTEDGLPHIGNIVPLPAPGEALHQYWLNKLPKAESTILAVLINAHPNALSKEDIGEKTNYSSASGSFSNALSKLRTLELIDGRQSIKASDDLFENSQ